MNKYNHLRLLLKNNNISTRDLASQIGITVGTLNKKIAGQVKFLDKDIEVILKVLDMKYEDVFIKDNERIVKIDCGGNRYYVSESTASKVESTIIMDNRSRKVNAQ